MAHEQTTIKTADGACPTHVFTPASGSGPWPGVIFYMDGLAIRPTLFQMSQRLADLGYVVLLPDLFYRAGPYPTMDPAKVFGDPDFRASFGHLMASTNYELAAQDTKYFLDYLDTRKDVAGTKVGVTGYCLGGGVAMRAAGTYPERIAAAASFHGGNLASDAAISPHLLAPNIKARIYVGVADNDPHYPPEMGARFDAALDAAGVDYRSELYEGAAHGWTMADFPIHDAPAAERHWRELTALFKATLG
jgi:carboxymethylenebutenolidase